MKFNSEVEKKNETVILHLPGFVHSMFYGPVNEESFNVVIFLQNRDNTLFSKNLSVNPFIITDQVSSIPHSIRLSKRNKI